MCQRLQRRLKQFCSGHNVQTSVILSKSIHLQSLVVCSIISQSKKTESLLPTIWHHLRNPAIHIQKLLSYTYSQVIFSLIRVHAVWGRLCFRPERLLAERKEDLAVSWWRGRDRGRPAEPKANWGVQQSTLNNSACMEMGRAGSRCWLTACLGCCGLCVEMFWLCVSCVSCWAAEPLFWPRVCTVSDKNDNDSI